MVCLPRKGKGRGPAPKGKENQASKKPVPPPSSSSKDELDGDQLAILDQLLVMEQAQGLAPGGFQSVGP